MTSLLLLLSRLALAMTHPTLDQHTSANPLPIGGSMTITGRVTFSNTQPGETPTRPAYTTQTGQLSGTVGVTSMPAITFTNTQPGETPIRPSYGALNEGFGNVGMISSGYRYLYWTQSYTGVSAFFSVTGTGQSFGKSSICLRQVDALMGGTYSFTLQGFVNTLMPGVLIGTFANVLDNTTQNNATASMTTFPFVQFNLTICTKCSSTTWISATLFIATN